MLMGRATCADADVRKERRRRQSSAFPPGKSPNLPAVVVVSLSRRPPEPERRHNAQDPEPGLHPAVLRGRGRCGGEEEPGGRREKWRAGRERGRAERRDAVG